jgi:hypothetical protein
MSRTYFPTTNSIGVRALNPIQTLGAYYYDGYRAPAEPPARPNQNPVSLGAVPIVAPVLTPSSVFSTGFPNSPIIMAPGSSAPGVPSAPANPVFADPIYQMYSPQYGTPTPQVAAPAALPPSAILVTSGGGTVSPAPAAAPSVSVSTGSTSITDQVASWLGGSTQIGSYAVPNALLAGGVAIIGMFLMGGKRR